MVHTAAEDDLIVRWLAQYHRNLLSGAVIALIRLLWLLARTYFFTVATFVFSVVVIFVVSFFIPADSFIPVAIMKWCFDLPPLKLALLLAGFALAVLGIVALWHLARGLTAEDKEIYFTNTTGLSSGLSSDYMTLKRQGNLRYGYAVGMWFFFYLQSFHAPVFAAVGLVLAVRKWLNCPCAIPAGSGPVVGQLLVAHQMRSWNPAADFPPLLPYLEQLLQLGVIRTRTNYASELEVHLSEPFLKFAQGATPPAEQ